MLTRLFALMVIVAPQAVLAQAPTPAAAPDSVTVTPVVRNLTRLESWSFFEPRSGGGDPDYTFIGNRLFGGVRVASRRFELNAGLQYVQLGGLPERSVGPGPLGSGPTYFSHNLRTDSRGVFLKTLNLQMRNIVPGLSLRAGRMGYASGGEAPSGDPSIETLKRIRLDSRLVGEFEWSLFQRAFDGARADYARDAWHVTGAALWPTQGGFDEGAGSSLRDVRLLSGALTRKPSSALRRVELQAFVHQYDDQRPVTGRPDNSGRAAARADISLLTTGGHVAAAYPAGGGRTDLLGWFALQRGDWYESEHRAWALALEAGYQWSGGWAPWVRAGWNRASGDASPGDLEHGTFMPPMPTARKYALSTAYAFMNLDDLFVQAILKPRSSLSVRADLHRLRLAASRDLWYAGSGATRRRGAIFGYAGRPTGGADALGTIVEGSIDWMVNRRWAVGGYAGYMFGGAVVNHSFAGDRLMFGYLESVIQF